MKKAVTEEEYKKGFKVLYDYLVNAHMVFYVWKGLQKEEYQKIYDKDMYFWNAVKSSLAHTWIGHLAKIYEKSSRVDNGQVYSVYYMERFQKDPERRKVITHILKKHQKLLNNLMLYRNNLLFHNGAKIDMKQWLEEHSMTYGEFEDLLGDTEILLHNIYPEPGHHFSLAHIDRDSEKSANNVMRKLNIKMEL